MVEKKIEENQGMLKEEVMRDGMKKGVFREGNSPDEIIDFGKHAGKTFKEVYLTDQEYCNWTMRQERPAARKLVQFKYFLRRMQDLTKRNMGMCGKADEIERQLRDRILQLSCEEQMGKLIKQNTEQLEKQEDERKAEANQKWKERQRADWADIGADESVNDMTCMNLGGSVQIVYPQEEQREEERRHGREDQIDSESDRRHEKLQSEKDGVIRILEGHEGYRKIIDMISETGDEEYGMQCFRVEFQERSGLDIDQVNVLECGIRWAVEARRREKGEQQEQWRQGRQMEQWRQGGQKERRQGEQSEQSAEEKVEGWIRQGKEETGGEEDGHERREGIESENDTGREDWGSSLQQERVGDIRQERRERGRVNRNLGGQVRLTGFGQDHWEGERRNWYQDQWWDSRSWGGKSETKGLGRMEKHWRRSREKFQSDDGSTSKGERDLCSTSSSSLEVCCTFFLVRSTSSSFFGAQHIFFFGAQHVFLSFGV